MRWVTYERDGAARAGVVEGDEVFGLRDARTLTELVGFGLDEMHAAAASAVTDPLEVLPLADASLRPPVAPPSIRDFLTFPEHLKNCRGGPHIELSPEWWQFPGFYFSNVAAVIGPYDPVRIPPGSSRFDFELEVGAVIGPAAGNVGVEQAAKHIIGYTIFCDFSARDLQAREKPLGLGPSKGKDSANTLGPMLVTVDELEQFASGPSYALGMDAFVNGVRIGGGRLDEMSWSFAEMVSYASRGTTLQPGDVLGSGTVPTGCLLEAFATRPPEDFPGWLQPGDVVRLEVDQLGAIEHEVIAGEILHPLRTGF